MDNINVKSERLASIDLLKCIAIFMVISLHVPLWKCDFISEPTISRMIQYGFRLLSEGVPLFSAINGFLLLRKNNFDLDQHIKKTKHLFLIIIMWSVILNTLQFVIIGKPEPFNLESLSYCLLQPSFGLWYLQSLLGVYLIFPIIWELYHNNYQLYKYVFSVETIVLAVIYFTSLLKDCYSASLHISVLEDIAAFFTYLQFLGNNVWFLYYFCLGGVVWHYWDKIVEHKKIIGIVGFASFLLSYGIAYYLSIKTGTIKEGFNYGSVFEIFIIIGLFAISAHYKGTNGVLSTALLSIGRNTFGIYITHMLIIRVIAKWCLTDTIAYRAAVFCVALLFGYIFSIAMNKNSVLKKMISL